MSLSAVLRLELRRLLVQPLPWVLAALTLAWLAWRFILMLGQFLTMQVRLAAWADGPGFTDLVAVPLLAELALLACAVVPLLCMSMLAGERRAGRLALYAGMGLSARALVLGKYLAALAWLLPWLLLVLAMPLSLAGATAPDWGKLAAAALGLALLLSTLAALAIACSAHVGHPALAAVLALVITLALWTLNLGARWAGLEGGALDALAMSTHLQPLLRGVVSSADVAWFVLVGALALALAVRRVDAEKARG